MQLYWQTLAHCLFSLPCNLHYDLHLMSSVSYSKDSDYLLSFQGLKLKVPLVTPIYSGILLKTVLNFFFFDAQNILSLGLDSALGFQENWQPKSQVLSLNELPVLNSSWAWSGSQQNWRQLSVILRLHQSIWGALWVAAVPTVYTRLWAGPLLLASSQQSSSTTKYTHKIWLYAVPLGGLPQPLPCRRRRTKVLHSSKCRLPPAHHLCEGAVVLGRLHHPLQRNFSLSRA